LLRSVKYGLYGAVLAGVVGGTVAWGSVDKTVTLVVDGQPSQIHTTASRVVDVLDVKGYRVTGHDIIAPAEDSPVHDGSRVIYNRGRLVHLDVNGARADIWTTAPTVSDALDQMGYSTADFSSVSRADRLPLNPTAITVRTPRMVTIVHDGKTEHVSTTDLTVGEMLKDLDIKIGSKDKLSVPRSASIRPDLKVVITRIKNKTITVNKTVPFKTTKTADPTLPVGQTKIVRPGKNGLARVTYAIVYVNGKMVGKAKLKTVVVRPPISQIEKVGTKPPSAPSTPSSAQAIAKALAAARGWGDDQFDCLVQLWDHESGWHTDASNPSGAYGIPQALPGSKMSEEGPNWQTDATTQIKWGLGYISDRYNDPCNAWAIWQAQGGWH
jgi:resuscitation-promoting factor RpfB